MNKEQRTALAPTPKPQAQPESAGDSERLYRLIAAAVKEKAGYIQNYLGSYNRELQKCTGCGECEDGWGDGSTISHAPDCSWVAQVAAINELREVIASRASNASIDAAMSAQKGGAA